jgi:hypothetical protein
MRVWFAGFDVVSVGATRTFECSPLSCNQLAGEVPVNRHCLVDGLERALQVARRFEAEQPEPGTFVVVDVLVRETHREGLLRLPASAR